MHAPQPERENLAAAHPDVAADLTAKLKAWNQSLPGKQPGELPLLSAKQ